MKEQLTRLAWPVLRHFETGDGQVKPMHRTILYVVGFLMLGLSAVSLYFSLSINEWGGLLAVVVFLAVGGTCLIVAFLGSDRAVAKIWGQR